MRIALVIVSVISMLIGINTHLHQPLKDPPNEPMIHALREIDSLPAEQRDNILPLIREGRERLHAKNVQLHATLDICYVASFLVGAGGLAFAMGRWNKRN